MKKITLMLSCFSFLLLLTLTTTALANEVTGEPLEIVSQDIKHAKLLELQTLVSDYIVSQVLPYDLSDMPTNMPGLMLVIPPRDDYSPFTIGLQANVGDLTFYDMGGPEMDAILSLPIDQSFIDFIMSYTGLEENEFDISYGVYFDIPAWPADVPFPDDWEPIRYDFDELIDDEPSHDALLEERLPLLMGQPLVLSNNSRVTIGHPWNATGTMFTTALHNNTPVNSIVSSNGGTQIGTVSRTIYNYISDIAVITNFPINITKKAVSFIETAFFLFY